MTSDAADDTSHHDVGGDNSPKLVDQGRAHVYDYTTNVVPGESGLEDHYWRDVGTLDSYFDAHMDLVARLPAFDLYNHEWPIFTRTLTDPPAKITDGDSGPSQISNSILASGVIVSGGIVRNSVVSGGVRVSDAEVVDSVIMQGVTIGKGARLRRCIIDKNVLIPPGFVIGHDPVADAERFTVSDGGVVAVAKNTVVT
jgi:glucose-1-phosphate adenylyltransferase